MEPTVNLRRLRDLPNFEVADGYPDVRDWTVRGAIGTALGTVSELLVDADAEQVRYLDVQFTGAPGPKRVLLPLRLAALGKRPFSFRQKPRLFFYLGRGSRGGAGSGDIHSVRVVFNGIRGSFASFFSRISSGFHASGFGIGRNFYSVAFFLDGSFLLATARGEREGSSG